MILSCMTMIILILVTLISFWLFLKKCEYDEYARKRKIMADRFIEEVDIEAILNVFKIQNMEISKIIIK